MDNLGEALEDNIQAKIARVDSRPLSKYEQIREKTLQKLDKWRMNYLGKFDLFSPCHDFKKYKFKLNKIKQTFIWNHGYILLLHQIIACTVSNLTFSTTLCYHCNAKYQWFSKALSIEYY